MVHHPYRPGHYHPGMGAIARDRTTPLAIGAVAAASYAIATWPHVSAKIAIAGGAALLAVAVIAR